MIQLIPNSPIPARLITIPVRVEICRLGCAEQNPTSINQYPIDVGFHSSTQPNKYAQAMTAKLK